ncbi:MAG: PDZ domain-containing protein, partial [Blastocatellia bacterium]
PFVEQEHILAPGQTSLPMQLGGGIGGEIGARVGRISALKIGGLTVEKPITFFSTDDKGAFAHTTFFQGNIGFRILRKFNVILDYRGKRIILEPNSRFKEPLEFVTGFTIVAEGPNYKLFRFDQIAEGTPAAEAGLRKQDIITAIDGKSASEFTLGEIEEMFDKAGEHTLDIKRGTDKTQQDLKIKLKLRPLI